jgi:hypothetical protein
MFLDKLSHPVQEGQKMDSKAKPPQLESLAEIHKPTLDEIHYDVDEVHGEAEYEGTNSLESIVVQTLSRLPVEVYERLMHGERPIHFFGLGAKQYGVSFRWHVPIPPSDKPSEMQMEIIVLSGQLCTMPLEDAMFTIAHELAHVYLGHTGIHALPDRDKSPQAQGSEDLADGLAARWLEYSR